MQPQRKRPARKFPARPAPLPKDGGLPQKPLSQSGSTGHLLKPNFPPPPSPQGDSLQGSLGKRRPLPSTKGAKPKVSKRKPLLRQPKFRAQLSDLSSHSLQDRAPEATHSRSLPGRDSLDLILHRQMDKYTDGRADRLTGGRTGGRTDWM